ncbi:MAG: hypothetical protein Q9165_007336 [Trypethelium subeluteriae]
MPKTRGKGTQNRHENGLAAPGKRIGKQKSNGNLRPQPNGDFSPTSSPPPSSPAVTEPPTLPQSSDASDGTASAGTMGSATKAPDVDRPSSLPDFSILSGADAQAFETGLLGDAVHGHGRMDESGGKILMASMGDSLMLAATILKSCPLRDVIAILIILLQLPPTFLTIVNALYTLLTFVPPTPGILPTLHEIYLGGTGTPSLGVIILMDACVFLAWLVLYEGLQDYILDLSSAVIAVSLGGAAAGKNGTTNAFLVCTAIVLTSHLNRQSKVRYYGHHLVWTMLSKISSGRIKSPLEANAGQDAVWPLRSWINKGFAIHIFSQGILRWLRRSLASLSSRDSSPKLVPNTFRDPESGLSPRSPRSNSIGADSNPETSSSASSDGRPPGQPPASTTGKEKDFHLKKKRKHANVVRRLQPFWAALASTKVTVMKEMEQAQPSPDAIEADATDVNHLGNANSREPCRIWISELLPTEIRFQGSAFRRTSQHSTNTVNLGEDGNTNADPGKPFCVRLNGADWTSTRIHPVHTLAGSSSETADFWAGEIFGLTPLSSYYCEFIRCSDNVVISAIRITSPPAPTAEQASAPSSAQQSFRPSSPTTTLNNSIVATDSTLLELRNKLKKIRKEHKSSLTSLRKELDSLNTRSESAGNNDDRQRQRIIQMRHKIQHAADASAEMAEQVDSLAAVPEDESRNYDAKKSQWRESQAEHKGVRESLTEANRKASQEQSRLTNEILSVTQKRDRLKARLDKLSEQCERLNAANTDGQSVQSQRSSVRIRTNFGRDLKEGQIISQIDILDRERDQFLQKNAAVQQKIHLLQSFYSDPRTSTPTTPEGVIPNSRNFGPVHAPTFPLGTSPVMMNSTLGAVYREGREARGRSSSMLSDISGLTDHQDAEGYEEKTVGASGIDAMSPKSQPGSVASGHAKALSPPGILPP